MSVPAAYLPEAEDDIAEAHAWYDEKQAGLGDEFVEAVHAAVNLIGENPQMYAVFRRDIRAAAVKRFPYVVYFRDRGEDVLIIAVQHGRRSTRAWRGRA